MAERYNIQLHARAEDVAKPGKAPDTDITVNWTDVPYEGLVAIEKLIVGLLDSTTEMGQARIDSKGARGPAK